MVLGSVGIWSCVNGLGKSATDLTEYEIAAAAKVCISSPLLLVPRAKRGLETALVHGLHMLAARQCLLQIGHPGSLQAHLLHDAVSTMVRRALGLDRLLLHQLLLRLHDKLRAHQLHVASDPGWPVSRWTSERLLDPGHQHVSGSRHLDPAVADTLESAAPYAEEDNRHHHVELWAFVSRPSVSVARSWTNFS